MQEVRRDGDNLTVSVTMDELRLLIGALNESLNGGYAFPADEWGALVGQPPERGDELLHALLEIAER